MNCYLIVFECDALWIVLSEPNSGRVFRGEDLQVVFVSYLFTRVGVDSDSH